MVTSIPIVGKKFYRNWKISGQVLVEFTKNQEEKKVLVKRGTHYLLSSIKPLWRFMLHAIIKYITLDTRFDHLCTYHFMLLNHFRYGVKIAIPFYLYSSMNESINEYQEKHRKKNERKHLKEHQNKHQNEHQNIRMRQNEHKKVILIVVATKKASS